MVIKHIIKNLTKKFAIPHICKKSLNIYRSKGNWPIASTPLIFNNKKNRIYLIKGVRATVNRRRRRLN